MLPLLRKKSFFFATKKAPSTNTSVLVLLLPKETQLLYLGLKTNSTSLHVIDCHVSQGGRGGVQVDLNPLSVVAEFHTHVY